jgi:tripartite-type tricarboxylate transporter receptor subunit TctC
MQRRTFSRAAGAALTLGVLGGRSGAQAHEAWPSRLVKIVVGFPPGQSSDMSARMFGEQLHRLLGQTFIVENRPGAGATLAAAAIAAAPKDGYSMALTSNGPLAIASTVAQAPLLITVNAASRFKTLQDLVAAGRATTEISYGSGGNGVTSHLAVKMFETATGTSYTHIPYKGTAPALSDLLGERIDFVMESPAPLLPLVRDGRLRVLATTGSTRYGELPDAPAVSESVPGFEAASWTAFAFPAGTPAAIVGRLNDEVKRLLETPEFAQRMRTTGVEPFYKGSPEACGRFLEAEYAKWGDVVRRGEITLD